MKKCPKCRTEYADSMEICPNDDSRLEFVNTQTDDFAEDNISAGTADAATETSATDFQNSRATQETPVTEVKAASVGGATTPSRTTGMSALAKSLIVGLVVLALGAGLVFWKTKIGRHDNAALNRITKEDMAILLKDADPMQLKKLSDNPEQKKKITENIRQVLAMASQARKEGIADDPNVKTELDSTRLVLNATLYDQKINGDKGPMPPFGYISEDQVKEFWNDGSHEAEFQKFLDSKIAIARDSGKFPKDKELSEDEIKQAKDDYAKIRIYDAEATAKSGELGEDYARALELQTKLQQASFLAGQYAQKTLVDKVKVTDEDVQKYIETHPELSPAEKKAKAEDVLKRAKAGEDFAKLADEVSDDPGTKGKGGLYKDVKPDTGFDKNFEQTALSLQPGQIADNLVESPFGYHIIKLERGKSDSKDKNGKDLGETYDVRHILISTTIKDPKNPLAREMPVNVMVRQTLEQEKQKQILDEIVANNPVEVAEDFDVPTPTEEQLQQMQQQMLQQQMMQQGMPQGGMPPPPPAAGESNGKMPPKSEPKKK